MIIYQLQTHILIFFDRKEEYSSDIKKKYLWFLTVNKMDVLNQGWSMHHAPIECFDSDIIV